MDKGVGNDDLCHMHGGSEAPRILGVFLLTACTPLVTCGVIASLSGCHKALAWTGRRGSPAHHGCLLTCHGVSAQVMERVERRPMSMGVHGKQMSQGQRQPLQPVSHDGDETVPLINGGLAAKAMKGRQSIAQFHSRPHAEVSFPRPRLSPSECSAPHALLWQARESIQCLTTPCSGYNDEYMSQQKQRALCGVWRPACSPTMLYKLWWAT